METDTLPFVTSAPLLISCISAFTAPGAGPAAFGGGAAATAEAGGGGGGAGAPGGGGGPLWLAASGVAGEP